MVYSPLHCEVVYRWCLSNCTNETAQDKVVLVVTLAAVLFSTKLYIFTSVSIATLVRRGLPCSVPDGPQLILLPAVLETG